MYITRVSGHRQATVAIQQTLKRLDGNILAPMVNGFGYTYPILEKIVHNTYMGVVKTVPIIWDSMYDNRKLVEKTVKMKEYLHKKSHEKFDMLFKRHKPDVVVSTQAFPCGLVGDYIKTNKLDVVNIGVLTDFAPHWYWINDGIDYYVVHSQEAKERFIQKGIDPDMIKVYGIPIRSKFANQLDKYPIALEHGLEPNIPTILIMGGGQGLGPIKGIVKSLCKVDLNLQIIVLAGKNKKVINSLRKYTEHAEKKVKVYEFVSNVDELMELATLIITKPGGITMAESLSKGLPMIIVDPLPGQEMRNTDFLIKKGVGIRIDQTSDVGEEVELLLKSPDRLLTMSQNAYENGKPHATLDIAKLILDHVPSPTEPLVNV